MVPGCTICRLLYINILVLSNTLLAYCVAGFGAMLSWSSCLLSLLVPPSHHLALKLRMRNYLKLMICLVQCVAT